MDVGIGSKGGGEGESFCEFVFSMSFSHFSSQRCNPIGQYLKYGSGVDFLNSHVDGELYNSASLSPGCLVLIICYTSNTV